MSTPLADQPRRLGRILSCSPVPLDPRLGMAKHVLESAEALRAVGWTVEVVGPDDIAGRSIAVSPECFPAFLRAYLQRVAGDYDVVEYDHAHLPFPRAEFCPRPLFVARCMLLHHHLLTTPIPLVPGLRPWLKHLLTGPRRRAHLGRVVAQTDATVRHADLTVVSNDRDAAALVRHGADAGRIAVLPLGLTNERLRRLGTVPEAQPAQPVVGFVGTFDPRKGMREFPSLADRIASLVPGVSFRLLGTAGLVADAAGVLRHFPRRLRPLIEVRPRYDPEELPNLLRGVSVGVFPSRVESFGYGVLEMLAASIPVVAYDAPGPDVMLTADLRVAIGDMRAMAAKVGALLGDRDRLAATRRWARTRAGDFLWDEIAARTGAIYARPRNQV